MSEGERRPRMHLFARAALTMVLAGLATPVLALGLGQIQVQSRPGQPLRAEIPIISNDPAELQGLQARLASPDTFRRVGLDLPQGMTSDLQFAPGVDGAGRPVIRVTSRAPVQEAGLTFLVEVDWGQGRLVREYSALVDAPRSVAAPVAPPLQAPTSAAERSIARAPATPPQPLAAPQPPPEPQPPAAPPPPAPRPAAEPPAAPPPAAPAAARPQGYAVKRGDTLGRIARQLPGSDGYSLDQTMLALLRANPQAFIGQDINRLREGAVLRAPPQDELARYSASQAAGMVREQIASWRQGRAAQVQPAVAAASDSGKPGRAAAASAARVSAPARRVAGARLEIAPPRAAAGTQAGTQSGASTDGEGEMLRQELQQTREALATRDAEVQELRTRVAELERLQKDQQQLIAMKDSALAGAQQNLASTDSPAAGTAPEPASQGTSLWPWLLAVALLAAIAAWWLRRRRPVAPPAAASKVSDAVAEAGPAASRPRISDPRATAASPAAVETATPAWAARGAKPAAPAGEPVSVPVTGTGTAPTWMAGPGRPGTATLAPLSQAAGGQERIELARAYADLGDRITARSLLQEVIDGGDASAREAAARMLQTL